MKILNFRLSKISVLSFLLLGTVSSLSHAQEIADTTYLSTLLNTLASDEMRGRSALSPEDIGKAADVISNEFQRIGLTPYAEENFRQSFELNKMSVANQKISINDKDLSTDKFLVFGYPESIAWNAASNIATNNIVATDDFSQKFRAIINHRGTDEIVWVDEAHAEMLTRFKKMIGTESITTPGQQSATKVFIVGKESPSNFSIELSSNKQALPLFNVVGMLPGKSKPEEYVIFSSHYDHIGILQADGQDSIANGADDDASGTTAVIALAKYYKELDENERTLIFVAFTGEEVGMYGSKYFSSKINPDEVVAMLNIEMIGKDSKFGPNSVYLTGYDASDLGKILQENVTGSAFTFHPDPYPTQNLFYRSDNATLAALGVPAHTVSTSQIDKDEYYHTVKDEVSTLDIQNIKSSIEAIAKGATGIVKGLQTPSRVQKLRD